MRVGGWRSINTVSRYIENPYISVWAYTDVLSQIHDLSRAVDENPDFRRGWAKVTDEIRSRRDSGDEATLKAISDALPVRFHNLANPNVSEDELRRAYLDDGTAGALRRDIQQRAEEGVLPYRAFLEARDRIGLLERYAPDVLEMTVSPRAGRLGVRPLPAPSQILPYHGVPVISADKSRMRVEYLWDLMRSGKEITPVAIAVGPEDKLFLYIE